MTPLVSTEEIGAASDDELIDLVDQWGDAYMEDEGIAHNLVGRDLMYELLHRQACPRARPFPRRDRPLAAPRPTPRALAQPPRPRRTRRLPRPARCAVCRATGVMA